MEHTSTHVFFGAVRKSADLLQNRAIRIFRNLARLSYAVDTGLTIAGMITENASPASNTRVVLINARSLQPVAVLGRVGSSYVFRSVAQADLGYFIMGIDLDGVYGPICQGPLLPVVGP